MAVIKNGKIKGKIGKHVYRVIDGKEFVQASPTSGEQTEGTKRASAKFANSAKTGSQIYRQVKSFASDFTNHKFYRELVSLLRGSVYLQYKEPQKEQSEGTEAETVNTTESDDWLLIQKVNPLVINKETLLDAFLDKHPSTHFSENRCTVFLPSFNFDSKTDKHPKGANCIELFVSVYHTHPEMTYSLAEYTSGRLPIFEAFAEQSLILPLEWMDNIQKDGIVYVCFGLTFYANASSRNHLNSEKFNPSAILGMWYK